MGPAAVVARPPQPHQRAHLRGRRRGCLLRGNPRRQPLAPLPRDQPPAHLLAWHPRPGLLAELLLHCAQRRGAESRPGTCPRHGLQLRANPRTQRRSTNPDMGRSYGHDGLGRIRLGLRFQRPSGQRHHAGMARPRSARSQPPQRHRLGAFQRELGSRPHRHLTAPAGFRPLGRRAHRGARRDSPRHRQRWLGTARDAHRHNSRLRGLRRATPRQLRRP